MAKNISGPSGMVQLVRDLLAAQQGFLSTEASFEKMNEAARIVTAAQVAYGQALMRANVVLFGLFLQSPAGSETNIRPSEAAHQPDRAA